MLLFSWFNIFHKWCKDNNLNGETLISTTEIGFTNDNIVLNWLQHFIHHIQNKRRDEWLLLIMDDYGSHITILFYNFANVNKIFLFQLSPYFTNLTQPLDT